MGSKRLQGGTLTLGEALERDVAGGKNLLVR